MALGLGLGFSGCIVEGSPATGDATFTWTFVGADCITAGVSTVGIQIFDVNGGVVSNDVVACSTGGITYNDVNAGDYSFDLVGFSSGGARLYESAAPFTVRVGANQYDVDLQLAQ
jgi:hypothetical protein